MDNRRHSCPTFYFGISSLRSDNEHIFRNTTIGIADWGFLLALAVIVVLAEKFEVFQPKIHQNWL